MSHRILGDVHGKLNEYINICMDADKLGIKTIQLGDLGFNYNAIQKYLNPSYHKFIKGNHDNHGTNNVANPPHYLGEFGPISFDYYDVPSGFFIGGGFSIDWQQRTPGLDYFANEELSVAKCYEALYVYEKTKPRYMFSHECPRQIAKMVGSDFVLKNWGYDPTTFTTRTSELLQECFEIHQPEFWYFGHYHKDWTTTVNNCNFTCLAELSYIDLEI